MRYRLALLGALLWVVEPAYGAGFRSLSGDWRVEPPHMAWFDLAATRPVGDGLRIASYNIENFTDGVDDVEGRSPRLAAIQASAAAQLIREVHPDILVIQEIENATLLELLNKALAGSYPLAAVTRVDDRPDRPQRQNLAVFSRVPLRGLRVLDFGGLHGTASPPRGLLNFHVELEPGHKLLVYAVHLKSNYGGRPSANYAQRRNALRILREDAQQLIDGDPGSSWEVMVVGDMNTDPDSPAFRRDPTLGPLADWVDLWRGRPVSGGGTIPTRHGDPAKVFPPAVFDRFIVTPGLLQPPWVVGAPQVLQKGVNTADNLALPGADPDHASDHYPVYLDIRR